MFMPPVLRQFHWTYCVYVQKTREDDVNGDGLYDQLDFQLSMPLSNNEQVTGVKLMLFFNYILQVILCSKLTEVLFQFSPGTQ